MSLEVKGITKLSELTIDADKDMAGKGLFNLKELAAGQTIGSILYKDPATGVLAYLTPGVISFMLMTRDVGYSPHYGSY